jgi:signal transduction histidine kinase
MERTVRPWLGWIAMAASAASLFAALLPGSASAWHRDLLLPGVLAVVLAAAVRWGPMRHIAPAAVLAAAAMALWLWPSTGAMSTLERVGASMFWTLPALVAIAIAGYPRLTAYRRAVAVEEARRAQRLQLARDLHDFVAHDLSGIVVQAQAARYVADSQPDAAAAALQRIEAAGLAALATMDRVVRTLHEPVDVTAGPPPTLDDLPGVVERFGSAGHIDARLDLTAEAAAAPRHVAATAYRVVVEALTNVRRHAPTATRVDVSVTGDASGVEVQVRNDAVGTPPTRLRRAEPGGRGLQGLRERVAADGGTLTAGPYDRGWEVVAWIPGRAE